MFFVVDPDKEVSPQHLARVWEHLWAMRDLAPVRAMLPTAVSSPCPLLPSEATNAVLVAELMPVPGESAWAPVEVDLSRFLDAKGHLRLAPLGAVLRAAVDKGEQWHDAAAWGSAAQRTDSLVNRRLSIFIRGWGDVVAASQGDPASLATLRKLQQLARHIVAVLTERSRALAGRNGHCSAYEVAGAQVHKHGSEMNERWRRAVDSTALRHRNLLTLSPWDVFPREQAADYRYINLLPVLACANSVSFRRDVDICHWNVKEFKGFFERVDAILRCSSETRLIAKQV